MSGNIFGAIAILVIYLFPSIVASQRKHYSRWGVAVLNIFLGWTLIGWVAALVWALSGKSINANVNGSAYVPLQPNEKKCPFCAERVLIEARKCKHCMSEL